MKKIITISILIFFFFQSEKNYCQSNTNLQTLFKTKFRNFLNWYEKEKIVNFQFMPLVQGVDGDSTNPYNVNINQKKRYLDILISSKMLSSEFIDSLDNYLQRCDKNFRVNIQYEHIAFGFEKDLLFKDGSYYECIKHINSLKVYRIQKKSNSIFNVRFSFEVKNKIFWDIEFKKNNGNWVISKINGDFPLVIESIYHWKSQAN